MELLNDFDPKANRLSEQPVITRYRDANSNLRTQLLRILKRAGVKPWEKLFQNLRSTRQTELAEQFPMHVVCEWIGNSQAVAMTHYLQTTDEHYEAACRSVGEAVAKSAALGDAAGSGTEVQLARTEQTGRKSAPSGKAGIAGEFRNMPLGADYCNSVQVGDTGLEPVTSAV